MTANHKNKPKKTQAKPLTNQQSQATAQTTATEVNLKPEKPWNARKYTNPQTLWNAISEYIDICKAGRDRDIILKDGTVKTIKQPIPITIAGLAYHLGFKSRQSMLDYEKRDDECSCIISRARAAIEADNLEKGLTGEYESRTNNLNLASNYGYSTKAEVDFTGKLSGSLTIEAKSANQELALRVAQAEIERLKSAQNPDARQALPDSTDKAQLMDESRQKAQDMDKDAILLIDNMAQDCNSLE